MDLSRRVERGARRQEAKRWLDPEVVEDGEQGWVVI
jgi:hypothetical protein